MKKLSIILVCCLFFLTCISTFANYETKVLATKMGNDPQVIQLLKNNLKLSLVNGIKPQDEPLPDDILNKINAVKEENIILANAVNTKFPEFVNLKKDEQSEILYEILNSSVLSAYWDCMKGKVTTFGLVVGGVSATTGALAIYGKCLFSMLIIDFVATIATGGAAVTAEAAAATPEVAFCKLLAFRTGGAVAATAITAFIAGLFSC